MLYYLGAFIPFIRRTYERKTLHLIIKKKKSTLLCKTGEEIW